MKILPMDPLVADVILRMERSFEALLGPLEKASRRTCPRGCARCCGF